jgi:hypothetical protein
MATPCNEADLESELLRIYEEGGRLNPPYWARRFYQLFTPSCQRYVGGVNAVRKMLDAGGQSSGLRTVIEQGRSDLAVETLVLSEKWSHLFKPWDRKKAQENLRLANARRFSR